MKQKNFLLSKVSSWSLGWGGFRKLDYYSKASLGPFARGKSGRVREADSSLAYFEWILQSGHVDIIYRTNKSVFYEHFIINWILFVILSLLSELTL